LFIFFEDFPRFHGEFWNRQNLTRFLDDREGILPTICGRRKVRNILKEAGKIEIWIGFWARCLSNPTKVQEQLTLTVLSKLFK
jgi:hypothetical protein